eukprot:TRINITY_DN27402_c0_g1_i1.p1 TRINITY_DN27402_c0_g1~~TRINITY_DN27402_c0_g1_i1.p1  ORF type:complete len:361 (+),score=76.97 TRINITY_DN27402_c0_g1_i1:64-1146(+)
MDWEHPPDSAYPPVVEGIAAFGMLAALLFQRKNNRIRSRILYEEAKEGLKHLEIDLNEIHAGRHPAKRPKNNTHPILDLNGMVTLGTGMHAPTYKCFYKGEQVTLKLAQFKTPAPFVSEVKCLERAKGHDNIVDLVGVFINFPKTLAVLYTYAEGEPLHCLCQRQDNLLAEETQWRIAKEIATGVLHLHNQGVMHRDLKSMNVIVDERAGYVVKIIDFGSGKLIADKGESEFEWWELWGGMEARNTACESHTVGVGTFDWMAPEIWDQTGRYTTKVDVYAFAMILYELATLHLPWSTSNQEEPITFTEGLRREIIAGHRPPLPDYVHPFTASLIKKCWHPDPTLRPSFKRINKMLNNLPV